MNIIEIINKKSLKEELSDREIKYVVDGFLSGEIKDYQMSALLMAILINDMTNDEIYSLTNYMALSGKMLDLSPLGPNVVDKHSTGGVGDKTTLIISPIVASCGVKVAKMSGRGLGHTGGTIDKLESIPSFDVSLTEEEFINQINDINVAITSQTEDVAVADKKIYALRDVSGTTSSIPLIASSIMSKKIALGAKKLVLDVKVGNGALVKNIEDARRLSKLMIDIGKNAGIQVVCVLTNMNVPLGNNVGNSLEVEEAIDILKNGKQGSLTDLCIELAIQMVALGLDMPVRDAKSMVMDAINSGRAYKKFLELVEYQHGDIDNLPKAKYKYEIKSKTEGYLVDADAYKLGVLSMELGAGRANKEDSINYAAGVVINKNINDYVSYDDVIMTLYTDKEIEKIDNSIFEISPNRVINSTLVYEIIKE